MEAKSSAKAKPCRLEASFYCNTSRSSVAVILPTAERQAEPCGSRLTRTIDLPTVHNARVERPSQAGAPAFLLTRYREATYAAALSAAIAPSETAVTTWRKPFARTSPATNTPGTLVAPDSSATM